MKKSDVRSVKLKVRAVAREVSRLGEGDVVNSETTIQGLDVDSLDLLDMVVRLEEAFSISLSNRVQDTWKTVGDVELCVISALTKEHGQKSSSSGVSV